MEKILFVAIILYSTVYRDIVTKKYTMDYNGYLVNKCHSQAINEDILLKATGEVFNRVYLKKRKTLHTLMKNIKYQINVEGTEDPVKELKGKQETLEVEIEEIIKKKQSNDEVERILLEKQYRERIVTYHDLEYQIYDLLNKNRDAELANIDYLIWVSL